METKELNPEKSLQIISDAIRKSRHDFEKKAGTPLMVWGGAISILAFAVWAAWGSTGNPAWNYLWFTTIFIWIGFEYINNKKKQVNEPTSFLGEVVNYIWVTFGIFAIVLSIIFCMKGTFNFSLIILILMGFSTMLTGFVVRNKWIIAAGIINGLGTPLLLHTLNGNNIALAMLAAAIITLFIPGMILNLQSKCA